MSTTPTKRPPTKMAGSGRGWAKDEAAELPVIGAEVAIQNLPSGFPAANGKHSITPGVWRLRGPLVWRGRPARVPTPSIHLGILTIYWLVIPPPIFAKAFALKDLAVNSSEISTWRGNLEFGGVFRVRSNCLSKSAENGLAAACGSVSRDGRTSRCCTLEEC